MVPSDACLDLIKRFEGCNLLAYRDIGGKWTIGWGHLGSEAEPIHPRDEITQAQADELLERDVAVTAVEVDELLDGAAATQCQYDAIVSLAFNVGAHAVMGSHLLEKFWGGDLEGAADEFLSFDHVGGLVVEGLRRRRVAERELFLGG